MYKENWRIRHEVCRNRQLETFPFLMSLRKTQVHFEVKSIERSCHSNYMILEAKHGRFMYLIINCFRKTNPRDHEKVFLTRVFISLKNLQKSY